MSETLFPIIPEKAKNVPLWVAHLAYKGYSLEYPRQPFERIAERGGFGQNEIILLLAEYARKLEEAA